MVVLSKYKIMLHSDDYKEKFLLNKDYIGEVPEWVENTAYFHELVADGKVVVTGKSDKELQAAQESPEKGDPKKPTKK